MKLKFKKSDVNAKKVQEVEGKAGFLNRLWSLIFTISLVAVILIALVLPIFGHQIGNIIFGYIGVEESFAKIWNSMRWIIPPTLIFLILTTMYLPFHPH